MVAAEAFEIEQASIRPIKRSEYDQMIGCGIFEGERVELIRGLLVKMSPQNAPHTSTIQKLNKRLIAQLGDRFSLRVQAPLAISDDSEPEPDIAVVAPGDYEDEHPRTALLIIEVSDSSIRVDRAKVAVYAAAGVGEYWIVNVNARTVVVHSAPSGDRYAEIRTVNAEETLRCTQVGISITIAEILPRA